MWFWSFHGRKKTRRTNTAAGKHKPVSRLSQLPFVGTIRVRCRTAFFCAVLGVRARQPFLSPDGSPSRFFDDSTMPDGMQAREEGENTLCTKGSGAVRAHQHDKICVRSF